MFNKGGSAIHMRKDPHLSVQISLIVSFFETLILAIQTHGIQACVFFERKCAQSAPTSDFSEIPTAGQKALT